MASNIQSGQPLFTIEQIELIRRLRNSGINKEQLVTAFETLDRIDRDLGPIYTIPVSLATHPFTALSLHQMGPAMMQQVAAAANLQRQLSQATLLQQQQQQQQQPQQPQAPQTPTPQPPSMVAQSLKQAHEDGSNDVDMVNMVNGNHIGSTRSHIINPMTQEEIDEIEASEEFKSFAVKGDIYCCEEIRQFVAQYNIKQQQVACLSGISQSYVSRYLKGDFHDMSERSRRAIQRWYIAFRKNPAAIGPAANAVMLNSPSPVKKFISMDHTTGEFVNYPRRERFVFRPAHLEVLERSFMEDSYPSQEKREDISRICNASVDLPVGKALGERERVTAQIVSNWFANKRKEMKKLAREEGIPPSQVPLRGRGRPSRFNLSDLHEMMANGNGMHNGMNGLHHGMEMEMAIDMKLSPTSLTGSNSPTLQNSNGVSETNAQTSTTGASPASSGVQGNSLNTSEDARAQNQDSSEEQESEQGQLGNSNNRPLDMSEADDQSLSLAVEMAAVNQAIIALSGQTPVPPVHAMKSEKE